MEKNWNLPGTFHLQSDLIDFYVHFRYNTDEITNHEGKQSMNQKELSELRRRWRLDKNAVSRIYGCFVNSAKEIVADLNESLGMLPQEEAEKYLSLLKKAMSGTIGKNLIDIAFTTQQVMDSEEHRLLMKLRTSALRDDQARKNFYKTVIESLDLEHSNYLILLAQDAYDVPHHGKNGEIQEDASETTFSYFVCAICPVKEGKVELNYFPGDNEFHCTAGRTVVQPELGFLFPAFDDRAANLYNALFYSRKADNLYPEFLNAVFHTEPPMSAPEQKVAFQNALVDSLGDTCSLDVVQAVHEQLSSQIAEHKERKVPEPLTVSIGSIGTILADCGIQEDQIVDFRQECQEQFGENAALNPSNLIDAKKIEIKTPHVSVSIVPEYSYLVETRRINGRKYLLIPLEDGVEFNGLAVDVKIEEEASN